MKPKTDIHVRLTGEDGNIFFLLSIVRRSLKRGGYPELADEMTEAVTHSKSYEEALAKFSEYVIVE
ncbi:MAG: hypothetical protein MJ033_03225 [Victivallaceae bacterium]|nr:hypothetical protein [Victivallaceae bacterium]